MGLSLAETGTGTGAWESGGAELEEWKGKGIVPSGCRAI